MSVRLINTIFTVSDDPSWGGDVEEKSILVAPDMILEMDDEEWLFLIVPKVDDHQEIIKVDRAKCPRFVLGFMHHINESLRNVDLDAISSISLLDFVRKYAKK